MNKVFLLGRITKVPEIKFTQNNVAVTRFNLAVDRRYQKEVTDFFTIVAWNKTAEFICKYIQKGQKIAITGRVENRQWEDDKGKHTVTEIIAEDIEFAESKKEEQETTNETSTVDYTQDELPF